MLLGGWVGGWGSAAGVAAAAFGVPLWHTVTAFHAVSEAEAWVHRASGSSSDGVVVHRVLLLVEASPSELPQHAAVLAAAERHANAGEFALLAVAPRDVGAVRAMHGVRELPAVVVYTQEASVGRARRSAMADGRESRRFLLLLLLSPQYRQRCCFHCGAIVEATSCLFFWLYTRPPPPHGRKRLRSEFVHLIMHTCTPLPPGSIGQRLEPLLAGLETGGQPTAPAGALSMFSSGAAAWFAWMVAAIASWASWGWVAATRYGELSVLLGMFVVATLFLQLDAVLHAADARQQAAPAGRVNAGSGGGVGNTSGDADNDPLGGGLHYNDRKLLFGLRGSLIPTLKARWMLASLNSVACALIAFFANLLLFFAFFFDTWPTPH
jgi:hypothetical protein